MMAPPDRMMACVATAGGPGYADMPTPRPGPGQALMRVHCAALNRVDVSMAAGGEYGSEGGPGTILGRECAGEVVAIGEGGSGLALGDRFMASTSGAFAEYAVFDTRRAYRLPDGIEFDAAATMPVSLSTSFNAVAMVGAIRPGDAVLVHGASSSVGLMAMQVARLMGAGKVLGTSTTDERRSRLPEFGADVAVDSRDENWADEVLAATDWKGVDLAIDFVSGSSTNRSMAATALGGRIVNVGRLGGKTAEFDFNLHALRRLTYTGVTFRTRSIEEIHEISDGVRRAILPAVADGRLRLPIARTLAFEAIDQALSLMTDNTRLGKIVLTMPAKNAVSPPKNAVSPQG